MARTPDLAADVAAYERTLRRHAGDRLVQGGDPTLTELQQHIQARRSRRVGGKAEISTPELPGAQADVPAASGTAGQVLAIEDYGPTVRMFRVGRPASLTFKPGQYLKVGARGGQREDFSVASAPHEPHLDLAIELRPGGKVTPALFALGVGDAVDISDRAKGSLLLDEGAAHHLMVATVTGIAPLRSMVLDALHRGTSARFTILHGASYAEELCFHDELVALAASDERVTYTPTVSRPTEAANQSWAGATGRVDGLATQIAASLDPGTTTAYAVGNAGMIDAVERSLGGAGFTVRSESYGG